MPTPSVIGYMPLCVTPRSKVCDEQGIGKWPMWKRFDSVKSIVDQYVDEPYRNFLALPYHEIDKLKAEELFYWYTPRCNTTYTRMSRTGDDHDYYKGVLSETLNRYRSVVAKLQNEGKTNEANFLSLSIKYAGESEDNVYCGDGRVVATVWGMRPRQTHKMGESKLFVELIPEVEIHTVRFELGSFGTTNSPTSLKKSHSTKIFPQQVPLVKAKDGYECTGWDRNPLGVEVTGDLLFTAQYRELPKVETPPVVTPHGKKPIEEKPTEEKPKDEALKKHHVRFLTPENLIIKELDVEHGKRILPGLVPQLPAVDKVMCPEWDGDPFKDIIDADRDYKAIMPKMPEKPLHAVRFLAPDGQVLSQFKIEHGLHLSLEQVPPLPVVNGKISPAWDVNPVGEVIDTDRDFMAKPPQQVVIEVDKNHDWHSIRFLNPDGSEVLRTQVMHGNRLKNEQIPPLPIINGKECRCWSPNPLKQVISKDTDFMAKISRPGRMFFWGRRGVDNGNGFWRWLLRIALFILLVFLVLYIAYLCNPCSK